MGPRIATGGVEKTSKGYLKLSRFLKVFRWVFVLQVSFLAAGLALAVGENDPRYVGELHPPVVISEEEKK